MSSGVMLILRYSVSIIDEYIAYNAVKSPVSHEIISYNERYVDGRTQTNIRGDFLVAS